MLATSLNKLTGALGFVGGAAGVVVTVASGSVGDAISGDNSKVACTVTPFSTIAVPLTENMVAKSVSVRWDHVSPMRLQSSSLTHGVPWRVGAGREDATVTDPSGILETCVYQTHLHVLEKQVCVLEGHAYAAGGEGRVAVLKGRVYVLERHIHVVEKFIHVLAKHVYVPTREMRICPGGRHAHVPERHVYTQCRNICFS